MTAGGQEQTSPAEGSWPPEPSCKKGVVVLSFCSFKTRWARAQSTIDGSWGAAPGRDMCLSASGAEPSRVCNELCRCDFPALAALLRGSPPEACWESQPLRPLVASPEAYFHEFQPLPDSSWALGRGDAKLKATNEKEQVSRVARPGPSETLGSPILNIWGAEPWHTDASFYQASLLLSWPWASRK